MTEIKSEGAGVVRIADEVIAVIAATAALEADGVVLRKHMTKSVTISITGTTAVIGIAIGVKLGKKLQSVSAEVQQRVKSAVETMTGLTVAEVNVSVGALISEQKRRA